MYPRSEHTLKIKLEYGASHEYDGLPEHVIGLNVDIEDLTVHGWFALFEKVLRVTGFSERAIMQGATNLAFREGRSPATMREVAKEYDLKLIEDLTEPDDESEASV